MLTEIRNGMGYISALYAFRKEPDRVIRFSGAISGSSSVLVLLPFGRNEYKQYESVISLLKKRFDGEATTIVSSDHAVEAMRVLPRSTFIHFRPDEIDFRFLPGKSLIDRIVSVNPDLVIDLNLDFLLPSGYIARVSKARIRVGFSRKHSDLFYNLQVRADRTLARRGVYERLAKFLERF